MTSRFPEIMGITTPPIAAVIILFDFFQLPFVDGAGLYPIGIPVIGTLYVWLTVFLRIAPANLQREPILALYIGAIILIIGGALGGVASIYIRAFRLVSGALEVTGISAITLSPYLLYPTSYLGTNFEIGFYVMWVASVATLLSWYAWRQVTDSGEKKREEKGVRSLSW